MKKIDTKHWVEYRVGDLFPIIIKPAVYHTREVKEDANGIPYVVRSKFDNGIKCRVQNSLPLTNPAGVISFGAENATFFYQEEIWCSGRDIYYIDTRSFSRNTCMFLIVCLRQIAAKYSYNFGLFPDLLKKEIIHLPATLSGEPDWAYMEQYVQSVETRVNASVSALNALLGGGKQQHQINVSKWLKFRVGDMFDIHPTKAYKLTNAQLLDNGTTPVIVNSAYNNGIGGYTTLMPTEKGNMVTFSDTVDAGTIYYQANDFVGYPHVQGLYPIGDFASCWTKERYLFFISMFRKAAIAKGFDYGNKFRRDIAIDILVPLPATSNSTPDWKYMDSYMQQMEQRAKHLLDKVA